MKYRVIQWGTGLMGAVALKEIIEHPDLELVGVRVYDPAKAGRDAAELTSGISGLTGVRATDNRDAIMALDADVVLHMPHREPDPSAMNQDVIDLLRSGKNVISTAGYVWPWAHGNELPLKLEEACRQGGTTLFGTGIVPGFVGERLAVALTGATLRCDGILMRECFSCEMVTTHKLYDVCGFGRDFSWHTKDGVTARTQTYYFAEEIYCIAHHMGVEIERLETDLQLEPATQDIQLKHGLVKKGTVGGITWSWTAIVDGRPFIRFENSWYVDRNMPGFDTTDGWTITVKGDTDLIMTLRIAEQAKIPYPIIAPAFRAIPRVCTSPAGILRQPAFAPWTRGYKKALACG